MGKPENKLTKITILILISSGTLLIMYLAMSIYFTNRFYFESSINCINTSGKTVEDVDKQMKSELTSYIFLLDNGSGMKEEIKGSDINLKYNYNSHDKIQSLKGSQNPFGWIYGIFNKTDFQLLDIASYDKELLKKCVDNLSHFNSSNIIALATCHVGGTKKNECKLRYIKGLL